VDICRHFRVLKPLNNAQIIVDDRKQATGIEVDRFRQKLHFRSRKEVIVSAGAVGSPQILLLSGIGRSDHLRSVGVEVKHHLPGVGENLQDHLMTSLWIHSGASGGPRLGITPFETVNPIHFAKYFLSGRGPLVSNGAEAGAFFHSGVSNDSWRRPDLQMLTFATKFSVDFGLKYKHSFNFDDAAFRGAYADFFDG
jgi:choline dehydrogenase-like flavoprotein